MATMGSGGEARRSTEEQARSILRAAKKALEEQAKRGHDAGGDGGELPSVVRSLERFLEKKRKTTNTTAAAEESSSSSPPAVL
jgi:hypothetical protein